MQETGIRTYTLIWFDTRRRQLAQVARYSREGILSVPVMRPRCLPSTSARSSSVFRNLSKPYTSVRFSPKRKAREMEPVKAMMVVDAMRHGRLGAAGGPVVVMIANVTEQS